MAVSIRSGLLGGSFTCALLLSRVGFAADADRVLLQHPVRYDPAEIESTYASEHISGFVEGSFAYGKGKIGDFSDNGTRWALRGTVNAETHTNWNIQLDGLYSRMSVDPVDIDSLVGAAHVYNRVSDAYAVGAFVQGSRFGSNLLDIASEIIGTDKYAFGIVGGGEAAVFTDMATFYGQLGFGQVSYTGVADTKFKADHLIAKAGARVYATDNIRFDIEGALNRFSGYGGKVDLYSLSAIGNYRFDEFPTTVFGGYQYDYGKLGFGGTTLGDGKAHTFLTGLRFHFGSDTLKDEERKGPLWSASALNL